MESRHDYVIVGGGLAAASAVEGIRERDKTGSVLLVAGEPELPYERPPLSKQLWFGKKKLADVFVHDEKWYAANGVELHLGRRAVALDAASHAVLDERGDRHRYRKLLLATGAAPRRLDVPGGDLDGISYFRTVADYRRLRDAAVPGRSAVVVGGGFIGSEVSAALAHAGVGVTMVFPSRSLCARVLPEALGFAVQRAYQERGVRVLAGDVPAAIVRDGPRFVTTTRGGARITSDIVVAGVGVQPALELAAGAGLAVGDGVIVDERLVTSSPDVHAAGDNALFPQAVLGGARRVEHWDNAIEQGRQAGRNMAGAGAPYTHMPFFFSDLFDFGYEAVGVVDARLETFCDWEQENEKGVVYYLAGGRVRGAMMVNVWDKVDAARALIRAGAAASPGDLRGAIR